MRIYIYIFIHEYIYLCIFTYSYVNRGTYSFKCVYGGGQAPIYMNVAVSAHKYLRVHINKNR